MRNEPRLYSNTRHLGDGFKNSPLRGYAQFGSCSGQTFLIVISFHVSCSISSINFIKAYSMTTWSNGVSRWQGKQNWMSGSAACQDIQVFSTSKMGYHVFHNGQAPNIRRCSAYLWVFSWGQFNYRFCTQQGQLLISSTSLVCKCRPQHP